MRVFQFLDYWGKARPGTADGPRWHPLAFHSLDVAAVGCALLEADPRLESRLAAVSGLGTDAVVRWTFLALALHDLGKFAPVFQAKNPERFAAVFGLDGYVGPDSGHDLDGRLLWARRLAKREDLASAFAILSGDRPRARRDAVRAWIESAICHHGKPRDVTPSHLLVDDRFKPEHLAAVDAYVTATLELATSMGRPQAAPADEIEEADTGAFPAHAGMNRCRSGSTSPRSRVPRARGDEPAGILSTLGPYGRSPRTRG